MTKKQAIFFSIFLLISAGIYYQLYKDSFRSGGIQISHRPGGSRARPKHGRQTDSAAISIMFGFTKKIAVTELKVLPVSDILTNKYPHPIWHLISDSNSVPTKSFAYGEKISGMRPTVAGVRPEPLEPDVDYRLIVDAGSIHAEHDFKIQSQPPP